MEIVSWMFAIVKHVTKPAVRNAMLSVVIHHVVMRYRLVGVSLLWGEHAQIIFNGYPFNPI